MINNIFTVDVEEYYHAENIAYSLTQEEIKNLPDRLEIGLSKLLDLLEKNNIKATFFVLGAVAQKNKSLIRKIHDLGHEIASHGYDHIPLYNHSPMTFEEDLSKSLEILSDIIGEKIIGYRAMNFSFSDKIEWFFDILRKCGITYDSSLSVSLFRRFSIQAIKKSGYYEISKGILEFPVSFIKIGPVKLPLGGGYFRAYPYCVAKWGIGKSARPALFYTHSWELDPGQPWFKIPGIRSFRHYFNLYSTENKLRRLLSEFSFISIRDFLRDNNLLSERGAK